MHGLKKFILSTVAFAALPAFAQETQVTPLMTRVLPDFPGKEALVITVTYPPGGSDPVHRHNADSFLYVLEGSVIMGVKGGKEVTLTPGQTFYEGPNDIHTVGRNASKTEPAKLLAVFVVDTDDKNLTTPAKE